MNPPSVESWRPAAQFVEQPDGRIALSVLPRTDEAEAVIMAAALAGADMQDRAHSQGARGPVDQANKTVQDLRDIADQLRRPLPEAETNPVLISGTALRKVVKGLRREAATPNLAAQMLKNYGLKRESLVEAAHAKPPRRRTRIVPAN